MTENDVVDAVAKHLTMDGWKILQALRTTEQGIDLVMARGDERVVLEAKGGTSTKEASARDREGFTPSQQRDHVAKAVAKACELRSKEPDSCVAIAFPDTLTHRRRIEAVGRALNTLCVWAYVVHPDLRVERIV